MSKHKYAYHIVIYKCCTCDSIESIWNSADVELPLGVPCRVCQSENRQINLNSGMLKFNGRAILNEKYIPKRGERVIVEYTPEMSLLYNKVKAGLMWNTEIHGRQKLSEVFTNPYDAALVIQKETYKTGMPFIITL